MPTSSTTAGEGVEMLMGLRSAEWSDRRGRTQFSGRMQTSRAVDSERNSYVSKVDSHALAEINEALMFLGMGSTTWFQ